MIVCVRDLHYSELLYRLTDSSLSTVEKIPYKRALMRSTIYVRTCLTKNVLIRCVSLEYHVTDSHFVFSMMEETNCVMKFKKKNEAVTIIFKSIVSIVIFKSNLRTTTSG